VQETSPPGRQGKKGGSSSTATTSRSRRKGGAKAKGRRLSAEAITAAAMRIADAEGLEGVSIRRVAAELGSPPMSLYSHISSKEELFSSMANEAVGDILVKQPLPEDWREAVAIIARREYGVFVSHPWTIFLFTRQPRFGPNATRLAKQMARAVASLSLDPEDIWALQGTVNDYVLGHSLRAASSSSTAELADTLSQSDIVEFPELSALQEFLVSRASARRFELGLQAVLDGVERRFLGSERESG
jgi:AcrR family transcriptional regulator